MSVSYKKLIIEKWGAKFNFLLPNIHRRNAAKWATRTFKAYFLAIPVGIVPVF